MLTNETLTTRTHTHTYIYCTIAFRNLDTHKDDSHKYLYVSLCDDNSPFVSEDRQTACLRLITNCCSSTQSQKPNPVRCEGKIVTCFRIQVTSSCVAKLVNATVCTLTALQQCECVEVIVKSHIACLSGDESTHLTLHLRYGFMAVLSVSQSVISQECSWRVPGH